MITRKLLILIRHASTKPLETGNVDARDYNEPLGEEGHRQVEALARRLADIDAVVWTSPQPRAIATAVAIARGRGVALTEPDLEDWRGEESAKRMYERVTKFTDALEGVNIIVSHGTPIAMILAHQVYGSYRYQASWGIAPASISVVQDGIVVAVNDTAHLGFRPESAIYDPHTWTYKDEWQAVKGREILEFSYLKGDIDDKENLSLD